jgi:hypothetical protein
MNIIPTPLQPSTGGRQSARLYGSHTRAQVLLKQGGTTHHTCGQCSIPNFLLVSAHAYFLLGCALH